MDINDYVDTILKRTTGNDENGLDKWIVHYVQTLKATWYNWLWVIPVRHKWRVYVGVEWIVKYSLNVPMNNSIFQRPVLRNV